MKKICEKTKALLTELGKIKLVAVTKTVSVEKIRECVNCGVTIIGENKIQEAVSKFEKLKDLNVSWHFIGHLQKNKVKSAVNLFDVIQSVDSIALARKINNSARAAGKKQEIMIEVNVAQESSKSGINPEELELFYLSLMHLKNIEIIGLMTIAPLSNDATNVKWVFKRLRGLRDMLNNKNDTHIEELSMGMTEDYKVACEEGATMVRIGRGIFGERARRENV